MKHHKEEFIERRIITGLIVSVEFIEKIQRYWNPVFLESIEFRKVASWCLEYYSKYGKAPDEDIENIYMSKVKSGDLSKAEASYIEMVLQDLSDEFGRGSHFNAEYLYDQTITYFKTQELNNHNERIQDLTNAGDVEEAEKLIKSFHSSLLNTTTVGLDLSSAEASIRVRKSFNKVLQRVISYPGVLGAFWNDELVRGAFVALLAPEKRGKSFMLMELAVRAYRQKSNVAFFQCGDMTEEQQLRRMCIHLARRSDREKYCNEHYRPVGDCVRNQLDICDRKDRNCDHGIFNIELNEFYREKPKYVNLETLLEKLEEFPEYQPCDSLSCHHRKGTVWLKHIPTVEPLDGKSAQKVWKKFFRKSKKHFKLATYPSAVLTPDEIVKVLNVWEQVDGFVPDVICIDYADLMEPNDSHISEVRHKQDSVWKGLRGISQTYHALLITATQADADSYRRERLSRSNYSEDKRKFAHCTAMYGLNQDPLDREKKLGILRLNEIVVRESAFSSDTEVHVLQDLAAGRAYLESF